MWQQLGRYLFKQIDALKAGHDADGQVQYLSNCNNSPLDAR